MIVPDINLLVYAYDGKAAKHTQAKRWWEEKINGNIMVGIPWVVSAGFVRLMTNPKLMKTPFSPSVAVQHVESWFNYEHIFPLNPGDRHLTYFRQILDAAGIGGDLVPDAHIAAIAMENQAEVHSNDSDFGRFPGVRWVNPLLEDRPEVR